MTVVKLALPSWVAMVSLLGLQPDVVITMRFSHWSPGSEGTETVQPWLQLLLREVGKGFELTGKELKTAFQIHYGKLLSSIWPQLKVVSLHNRLQSPGVGF